MRTIKFRGKRINRNGEWAYGDLRILSDRILILPQGSYDAAIDRDAVDETTIGQFTDLHDKNGKEIYEGDIVELREPNGMQNICKVEMCERCYWCVSFGIHERIILGFIDKNQITVVGNIHDNLELLKNNND